MMSVKLQTTGGERWIEGTVFEGDSPRLTQLDGVDVEAPLEGTGTLLVIRNEDQPGVIGEVGTILGRHQINIGSFALGRSKGGAVGVVNLDQSGDRSGDREPDVARRRGAARGARHQGSQTRDFRARRRVAPVLRSSSSTASGPTAATR